MPDLTVYGRATSSNVQAVMWGLTEIGLTATRLDYGFTYGGTDTPEFRAMNPNGLVPVLKDGDLTMFESCAILRYLAARYGDGGAFWPADPVARARIDQWAEWGKTSFCTRFTGPIFWMAVRMKPENRDEAALAQNIAAFDKTTAILEDQLSDKTYACGDTLTLADIVIGHSLFRYYTIDIPRPERPNLKAYYDRLKDRPAFAEHVMVSYESLKETF